MQYLNIAFYYFAPMPEDLEALRGKLKSLCIRGRFRGTILLAKEGVNMMISGEAEKLEKLKDFFRELLGSQTLFFKESYSEELPFNRMLVKVKKQLIPVDDPSVDPAHETAPHLPPEKLKQWLDEGKDIVLLDTRNDFEVQVGTFEGAQQPNIESFRDFEDSLEQLPEDWKDKTVVAFCTGGIRCEKATPLMKKHGFKDVLQLDGGILNYFEKVGGDHWQGDCFVFDKRVALTPKLEESDIIECFQCRHPVTPEEQKLPSYVYEVSCPYCVDAK